MKIIKKISLIAFIALATTCRCNGTVIVGSQGLCFMKQIKLTQGKIALVDDADYDLLIKHKWFAWFDRYNWYSSGSVNGIKISMHRYLMGLNKGDKREIDHIDGDGLNNQRCNLRICTHSQNMKNQGSRKNKVSSQYIGVSIAKFRRKNNKDKYDYFYRPQLTVNYKRLYLGIYPLTPEGEILAAKAYDKAAKEHHKEFATLNFTNNG